jgi:hypothetical protein
MRKLLTIAAIGLTLAAAGCRNNPDDRGLSSAYHSVR